eukprot:GHVN01005548.1.p2 GENE.GHVN01005548.1~~GHVN01005548.1.p2  ORF type:complete len:223 (-),score=20.16 GHVN01005548.1:1505-2173(-)
MSEAGQALCSSLCKAFEPCLEEVETDSGRKAVCNCIETCEASLLVVPLYDKIFGPGMVANQLKKDLEGSATGCKTTVLSNPMNWKTVDGLIVGEVQKRGYDVVRQDKASGVVKLLWMKRALEFIATFLDNAVLRMPDKSVKDAASDAYNAVLKPYHGMVVAAVVSAAFRLAPGREDLLKSLGFESMEAAKEPVHRFLGVLKPVLASINASLDVNECNFDDKA